MAKAHPTQRERPFEPDMQAVVAAAERAMKNPFILLSADVRQLLTCVLAGNHPDSLDHLREPVVRALAQADMEALKP